MSSTPIPRYDRFEFRGYGYDPADATLRLDYGYRDGPAFQEQIRFEGAQAVAPAAQGALDRVFRLLFLFCGVSYYKAVAPPLLTSDSVPVDAATLDLVRKVYRHG